MKDISAAREGPILCLRNNQAETKSQQTDHDQEDPFAFLNRFGPRITKAPPFRNGARGGDKRQTIRLIRRQRFDPHTSEEVFLLV